MPSDQPYNELGQILASGGEIALGLAISQGWSSSAIALLFQRRFEPMRPEDREHLTNLANAALASAAAINEMAEDAIIDPADIPTNPYLFGDDPAGRRGKVAYRFSVDEGLNWFAGRLDVADIGDRAGMFAEAEEQAASNWNKYPEANARGFGGPMPHLTIELILTEKRF